MNQYKVTILLETWSPCPEEWISEGIIDQLELEEGETLHSVHVERVTLPE